MKQLLSVFEDRGSRWEKLDYGTYYSIIQTHKNNVSLKNEWGGWSGMIRVGQPKYINKVWKDLLQYRKNVIIR